jgi:hypothetical protein
MSNDQQAIQRGSDEWFETRHAYIRQLIEARKQTLTPYQQSLREQAAVLIERHQEPKKRKRFSVRQLIRKAD